MIGQWRIPPRGNPSSGQGTYFRAIRCFLSSKYFLVLLSAPALFACFLLYSVTFDASFVPRRISYDYLGGWFNPWQQLPVETGLYQGLGSLSPTTGRDGEITGFAPCEDIYGISHPLHLAHHAFTHQEFPQPSFGSLTVIGATSGECFARDARLGPYGLDTAGGWSNVSRALPWRGMDLARLQETCLRLNQDHFRATVAPKHLTTRGQSITGTKSRTAVVLRAYDGFEWTDDDIVNVGAMLTELSLFSGVQYQLFILLHVTNKTEAAESSDDDLKNRYIPSELVGLAEVWSYVDVEAAYPDVGEYDVFYHTWMPVQLFALRHPEFDYVWNWEMDIRYTGHYGRLFQKLVQWAEGQSGELLTQRNSHFYIPSHDGSFEEFTGKFEEDAVQTRPIRSSNATGKDTVDLITLFPIFDPKGTYWPYQDYMVHYSAEQAEKPRRASIGTNHRLSRDLLRAMHDEHKAGRALMSEAWPPTIAIQQGFKAVFAPHPVWMDRQWPSDLLWAVFDSNTHAGVGAHVGGPMSKKFGGSSWYYTSGLPIELYTRWLGNAEEGPGSEKWEAQNGQMCLPGMLLHPVKSSVIPS